MGPGLKIASAGGSLAVDMGGHLSWCSAVRLGGVVGFSGAKGGSRVGKLKVSFEARGNPPLGVRAAGQFWI